MNIEMNNKISERVMRMGIENRVLGYPDISILYGMAKSQIDKEESKIKDFYVHSFNEWLISTDYPKPAFIIKDIGGGKKGMEFMFITNDNINRFTKYFERMCGTTPVFIL